MLLNTLLLQHSNVNLPSKDKDVFHPCSPSSVTEDCPSSSGRDSVVSCDSFDSGVSSRSDHDPTVLPLLSETEMAKPITIEVAVSPANRTVIELIDNGGDCFIGYFKTSPNSSLTQANSCSNCTKRTRICRSISTNVSEDSNDSAFQGLRSSRSQRDTGDTMKPLSFTSSNIKLDNISQTIIKNIETPKRKCRLSRKRHRSPVNAVTTLSTPAKRAHMTPSQKHKSCVTSKQSAKQISPAKRALLRIQHHNRSPERPDDAVTPTAISVRNCRTRSHAKSLLKDIMTSPRSSTVQRPKHRRSSFYSKSPGHRGPMEGRSPRPASERRSVFTSDESKSEDSGVGSDDQRSETSSACQWR